jgi:hypothetical protein
MSEEKEHLLWHAEARGRWWLEQRDDLVKIFAKFAMYMYFSMVVSKSSVHVMALLTNH